jgi:photosystem II stability/assembly factor-like uncharacterized protein
MRAMSGTGSATKEPGHRRARTPFVAALVLVTAAIASILLGTTGAGAASGPGARGVLAGAGVSVGHSGWFWGDPQPQGNTLNGIDFAGSRGYAAGDFGTLLRTDDDGATWEGLPTGITAPLVTVRAIDSNTVVIGGDCALRRSDDGGQTFTRLPWTGSDQSCPSQIASFYFPSPAVGYLMTQDGSILRTDDGGTTFSRKTSIPGSQSAGGSRSPTDIFFTGANTGVVTTRGQGPGKIFRTTDGGNSWVEVASAANGPGVTQVNGLNGLDFAGGAGYAVGDGRTLLKTVDGGAHWAPRTLTGVSGAPALASIGCAGASTCLITEPGGGQLVRTTDSGNHGSLVSPSTEKIFAAAFASATRAVAVGESGATVVSNNGGSTWAPVGGRISGHGFENLRATNSQLAEAGGNNGILARTVDGGANWFTVGVTTPADIRDASFPSQNTGFALDTAGGVFKTVNGGSSWSNLDTGASATPKALLALDANRILLVGPKGLRISTNGGNSFKTVKSTAVKGKPLDNIEVASGALIAFGRKQIAVSKDKGKTWKKVKGPKKQELNDVDFLGASKGYALADTGELFKTSNGGDKWKVVKALGTDAGTGISFSSASSGYVSVDRFGNQSAGYVFRTKDGGKTWQPQLIAPDSVEVRDEHATGFAISPFTDDAGFFATTTGGQAGDKSKLTLDVAKKKSSKAQKKVKVLGKLSPPEGGEQIVVSSRKSADSNWKNDTLTAASNGKFTAKFKVKKNKELFVVAQWSGDDNRAGTGTKVLTLTR